MPYLVQTMRAPNSRTRRSRGFLLIDVQDHLVPAAEALTKSDRTPSERRSGMFAKSMGSNLLSV
jgi:hypothetical protein